MNQQKRKGRRLGATVVATALAIAILLGGTFAWTAISQRAANVDFDITESGGRVHDHFDRESGNKDVFAENYGNNPLIVRIRLSEFMQIDGTSLVPSATLENRDSWTPINISSMDNIRPAPNPFREHVSWEMGGQTWFMPTHNRDNTDLRTETSGDGMDYIEVSDIYFGMDTTQGSTAAFRPENGTANRVVEGDTHTDTLITRTGTTPDVTHTAQQTIAQEQGVITMYRWIEQGRPLGNFWVVDEDGWAYWANLLQPGEATSLLLNSIDVFAPEGEWFYGIDVYGQFATRGTALAELEGRTENGTDLIRRIIGEVGNDNDLEVGDTFEDDEGIEWLILEILPTGETLITTYRVMGANPPLSTEWDRLGAWNTWGTFGTWDVDGPVNQRLETFWPQIGSDMRDVALVPNIPSDHRVSGDNWPSGDSDELLGVGTIGEAGTGLTAPTATSATTGLAIGGTGGTGALFHLSLAETNRYFLGSTGAQPSLQASSLAGHACAWFTRSPGNGASFSAIINSLGNANNANALISYGYNGIRPALWISGVPN